MADTFKGIITADGKKRQLPYSAVWETPVSDETLSIQGAFADAKVVGDKFKKTKVKTDSLKEDITSKADKTALARTDRSLDALWKLNQGISYEFQTDDTEAYQKMVPSGAKMANVKSIGGKTIVWNQLANPMDTSVFNGIDITKNDDNSNDFHGTISKTATYNDFSITKSVLFKRDGRKYLIKKNKNISMQWGIGGYGTSTNGNINSFLFTANKGTDWSTEIIIAASKGDVLDISGLYINVFDLTQMFGVGNEPTIEEFEAMFPADYYPYNAGELMSASVNEVIYLDTKNQETSYPIPQAILDLDGYGDGVTDNVYNYVDWENKKYHKRVGKYTIDGSEDIYKENSYWVMKVTDFEKPRPSTKNAICVNFKMGDGYLGKWGDVSFRRESNGFVFSDSESKFANSNEVKDYFRQNNETIYYELNEEQIIDISDIIDNTFQEPIEVEAGDTLTFRNSHGDDYRIPVPNSEEYVISLAEVVE